MQNELHSILINLTSNDKQVRDNATKVLDDAVNQGDLALHALLEAVTTKSPIQLQAAIYLKNKFGRSVSPCSESQQMTILRFFMTTCRYLESTEVLPKNIAT